MTELDLASRMAKIILGGTREKLRATPQPGLLPHLLTYYYYLEGKIMTDNKFSCGKCGLEPQEWDRKPEAELADCSCPRCGKEHVHIKTELKDELVPVDEEDKQLQNIAVTVTGRKIHGFDRIEALLRQMSSEKFCRDCGEKKTDGWMYSSRSNYDVICPECRQKHLEEPSKLIPVDDGGNRLNVLTDSDGNSYLGEEGLKKVIFDG